MTNPSDNHPVTGHEEGTSQRSQTGTGSADNSCVPLVDKERLIVLYEELDRTEALVLTQVRSGRLRVVAVCATMTSVLVSSGLALRNPLFAVVPLTIVGVWGALVWREAVRRIAEAQADIMPQGVHRWEEATKLEGLLSPTELLWYKNRTSQLLSFAKTKVQQNVLNLAISGQILRELASEHERQTGIPLVGLVAWESKVRKWRKRFFGEEADTNESH